MDFTLDTNCIIDLEENRPAATDLRALIKMHSAGDVQIAVVGISASENLPGGGWAPSFDTFTAKVARAGLGAAKILKPLGVWGVTYWNWFLWSSDEMKAIALDIHNVLFPDSEYDHRKYCISRGITTGKGALDARWRNRRCDVLALWSHVYYHRDVFVTRDGNFLNPAKQPRLKALGAGTICTPSDACAIARIRGRGQT